MEFHKLVSTSQATDWYSPGSEHWSVRVADLTVLRVARARKDWTMLSNVWLGTFSRPRHHVVWKKWFRFMVHPSAEFQGQCSFDGAHNL